MDREKVIEIIKDRGEIASAVGMHDWIAEAIADELIANGMGDITEWKHRADVAEEALRGLLKKQIEEDCPSIGWKTVIKDCDYKTKSHEDCSKCWTDFITQQAKARLKEKK